jgi:hypothetical protein
MPQCTVPIAIKVGLSNAVSAPLAGPAHRTDKLPGPAQAHCTDKLPG